MNERSIRSITTTLVILFISLLMVGIVQAIGGELIWTDELHIAGGSSSAGVVAIDGGKVFAAGFASPNNGDLVVRAYDGKMGVLLWQDQFDRDAGNDDAHAIMAKGGQVFAAGFDQESDAGFPGTHSDFVVRIYDVD